MLEMSHVWTFGGWIMKPYNDETKELYDEAFRLLNRAMEILEDAFMAHCEATGTDPYGGYNEMKDGLESDKTI